MPLLAAVSAAVAELNVEPFLADLLVPDN